MYDRKLPNPRPIPRPESRVQNRIETLIGITGWKMAKYRDSWEKAFFACLSVVWRPHLFAILLFEVSRRIRSASPLLMSHRCHL